MVLSVSLDNEMLRLSARWRWREFLKRQFLARVPCYLWRENDLPAADARPPVSQLLRGLLSWHKTHSSLFMVKYIVTNSPIYFLLLG